MLDFVQNHFQGLVRLLGSDSSSRTTVRDDSFDRSKVLERITESGYHLDFGIMDIFLHDIYGPGTLDDFVEDRLEDGGTAAWYHVKDPALFGTTRVSPATQPDNLLGKGRHIPLEKATALAYIAIDKTEDELLAATAEAIALPIYVFNYNSQTNEVAVYLAKGTDFTSRGTLPLSNKVRETAIKYEHDL